MSALEKMIAQIYERKDRLIDKMQQQADSYTQQLASRLLIDGITPPPCLLSPNFNSQSSNPNELEKEKIISRLLLQPPRHTTRYSTSDCSLFNRPVTAGGKGRLSSVMCMDNYAPNKALNVSNEPATARESNEIVCSLNCVPELDDSVKSPLNEVYNRPVAAGGKGRLSSVMCMDNYAANKVLNVSNEPATARDSNEIVCSLNRVPELDDSVKSPLNEVYNRPVAAGGKGRLSSVMCMDNYAPNKALNVSNEPATVLDRNEIVCSLNRVPELDDSVKSLLNEVDARISSIYAAPDMSLECHNNDIGCSLNCVPELDDNIKSPLDEVEVRISSTHAAQDMPLECDNNDIMCSLNRDAEHDDRVESPQVETNARITSIYVAPDMSLARIQRSKSRQKARELRTSGKTSAKSCLSIENRTHISFSGGSKSEKDLHQVTQDKHPLGVDKCNGIIGSTSMALEEEGKANDRTSHSVTLAKPSSCYENPSLENDLANKGSSSDKENLDGVIKVQPIGDDSSQQDGHVNCVMEGLNLPHICLGSYASKKTRTGKKHGAQNQSMPYSGRMTRSRSTRQQISGKNKSSNTGTSVSCNSKEGRGVLKPVISSNIDIERSSLGDNRQENVEIVARNGPIDAPVVMQPVGIKLDLVTSDCCMKVKPKQLNFDEIRECGLNETCLPLSKKRNSDVMLGQECYPLKESASSIDHKSRGILFEQQLPNANVVSSSPKAATTESCNNTDECAKDVMIYIGFETNVNSVVDDVEHNSMVSLHSGKSHFKEDHTSSLKMQIKEGDVSHKSKESPGVFIPVSPSSKSPLISSLTKQGNKDFDADLGSSISKDFEDGTNLKLSRMRLNSAKSNTCPLNQQINVEYRPNCFSDSRKFRVPIQRDAIHLNLRTPENVFNSTKEPASILSSDKINLSQSDGIQSCDKSFHNEIICDLPEETESLHELQAAEATVTEVDDDTTAITDTLRQFEPTSADVGPVNPTINDDVVVTENNTFEVNLHEWVSSYNSVQPSQNDDKTMVPDEITPVYEGFFIDEEIGNLNMENNEAGIDLDPLEIPSTTIARASVIEQICISASMHTPSSQFSHQFQDLYGFMADGNHRILDEGSRKHLQTSDSCVTEIDSVLPQHQKFNYGTPFYLYSSPTGKLWDRSASSSGSSEKQLSSNPDLTCFPIVEDPNSNEENENAEEVNDELQENIIVENENSVNVSPKMEIERTENDYDVAVEVPEVGSQHAKHVSTKSIKYSDTYSSNIVSTKASVSRTREKVKHKPKIRHGFKASTYNGENRSSSIVTRASTRGNLFEISKNKSNMRSGIPRSSQKETKHNNIVSNITSFVSLVQQKQAAAVCTVKRDIKVKALEAAEATKRREQDKENERRMKKEALKLERARVEKENAKQMQLNMIKKHEELKKKEADIAARKRLREEEEKKQVAKKRKLVAEAQKNQKLNFEKTRVGKMEIEKHAKNAANVENKKKSENLRQNKNANESSVKKQDNEFRTNKILANVVQQVESVAEIRDPSNDCGEKDKATNAHEKSPVTKLTSQENSYDVSPYQCSDDDDDEEDDRPTKKFIPSWASSKNRVAMVLPLQHKLNPESIFSADSFCNMDEVLLPRRLQGK